jgi:hypothetical protein
VGKPKPICPTKICGANCVCRPPTTCVRGRCTFPQ